MNYSIVIPTVGRDSLNALLESIQCQENQPDAIHVVHDQKRRGPAWARNQGWRRCDSPWVVFLDDDVVLPEEWSAHLLHDLAVPESIAGVQGCIVVPTDGTRLTDDERMTVGLSQATWATADMAYRRDVLQLIGGFNEKFPRAFREDSDLALRVEDAGFAMKSGTRVTVHPLRQDPFWASVRRQRGNADDVYMRRKHGPDWRIRARAPSGRIRTHWLTSVALILAPRSSFLVGIWAGLTCAFVRERFAGRELMKTVLTSVAIPPVAVYYQVREVMFGR